MPVAIDSVPVEVNSKPPAIVKLLVAVMVLAMVMAVKGEITASSPLSLMVNVPMPSAVLLPITILPLLNVVV